MREGIIELRECYICPCCHSDYILIDGEDKNGNDECVCRDCETRFIIDAKKAKRLLTRVPIFENSVALLLETEPFKKFKSIEMYDELEPCQIGEILDLLIHEVRKFIET